MYDKFLMFAGSDGTQTSEEVVAEETKVEEGKAEAVAAEPEKKESSISDSEAKLLKENMKKKAQIQELQGKVEELSKAIETFKGLGSFEELSAMIKSRKDEETKQMEAKGEWEKLKKQMGEDHAKAMAEINTQMEELNKKYEESQHRIIELTVGSEFANSTFISNELTLTPAKARVIYGDYFELKDGKVVGYDKPRGTEGRTAFVDQYGNTLPFNEALKKIVSADPDVESLMKSKSKPGAGSTSHKSTVQKPNFNSKTGQDKISAGLNALLGL